MDSYNNYIDHIMTNSLQQFLIDHKDIIEQIKVSSRFIGTRVNTFNGSGSIMKIDGEIYLIELDNDKERLYEFEYKELGRIE